MTGVIEVRFFDDMPPEDKDRIFKALPRKERLTARLVSKNFRDHAEHASVWRDAGAADYNDFVQRMQALPPEFQSFILSNEHYTLNMAESDRYIVYLPGRRRAQAFFAPKLVAAMRKPYNIECLLSTFNGIFALREELITLEEADAMPSYVFIKLLTTDGGILALREKLITSKQAAAMSATAIAHLTSANGILALREGLITLEQANAMPNADLLEPLITDGGILALREGLITLEDVAVFPCYKASIMHLLTTANGLLALREGLVTVKQAAAVFDVGFVKALTTDNGILALREKLITTAQAANMCTSLRWRLMTTNNGIVELRKGLTFPKQAASENVLKREIDGRLEREGTTKALRFM